MNFEIKKRKKNGRAFYYALVPDPITGEKKEKGSFDKEKLIKQLEKYEPETEEAQKGKTRLGEYLKSFMYEIQFPHLKDSTIDRYKTGLKFLLKDPLMKKSIGKITNEDLVKFKKRYYPARSRHSYKEALKMLSPCFLYAYESGHIARNPYNKKQMKLPPMTYDERKRAKEKAESRYITEEDQNKFTKYFMEKGGVVDGENYHTAEILFLLQLYTGLRVGEAMALKWDDITEKNGSFFLNVDKTLTINPVKQIQPPKTEAGERTLIIPPKVVSVLKRWKQAQEKHFKDPLTISFFGENANKDNIIFTTKSGKYKDYSSLNTSLRRICKKLDIPRHTTHDFRHTFCTNCYRNGLSPKEIQWLLGDKDLSTAMRVYTHIDEKETLEKFKNSAIFREEDDDN